MPGSLLPRSIVMGGDVPATIMGLVLTGCNLSIPLCAPIEVKTLMKEFAKGINTIEIATIQGDERIATRLIIDIEI